MGILLWTFSGMLLRPLIKHLVAERSGRSIDFDELHVRFDGSLDPTVEFRGLLIQNASWAASRPFVQAGMVSFTFSWRSFFADQIVVRRLVLLDAEVDLERQPDGLRNWRLLSPDDRGPQQVKVLALDAMRSGVRFVHRGIDLEFDTRIAALTPSQTLGAHTTLPLTKSLAFRGASRGRSFDGQVALSDVITFSDTSLAFALRGDARVGGARVVAEGVASDLLSAADFDLDLHLSLRDLKEFWPSHAANAGPSVGQLVAEAHVKRAGSSWNVSRIRATVGHTDLAGDLTVNDVGTRPNYRATLQSRLVDVHDFVGLTAMTSAPGGDAARTSAGLPPRAIQATLPASFDARVHLTIAKLTSARSVLASDLQIGAELKEGILNLQPVELIVFGGRANGSLRLDTSRHPADAVMEVQATGVRLDALAPAQPAPRQITGELDARVTMRSRGDSLTAIVDGATGSLSASLRDATISDRLDAELGLSGGGLLHAMLTGNQRVPVQCAVLAVDFANGHGTIRRLAFETERTVLDGTGSVSLANQSVDAVVIPTSRQRSLLTLDKAIRVSGALRAAKVELVDRVDRPVPTGCRRDSGQLGSPSPAHPAQRGR